MGCASRSLHPPPGGRAPTQPAAGREEKDEPNRPVLFSSSGASPFRWTVGHSLGAEQRRPWWKVVPLSLALAALLLWCCLRLERGADRRPRRMLVAEELEPRDGPQGPGTPAAYGART